MGCECLMGDGRRDWGSVPNEIHRVAVEEYRRTGAIPPAGVLADLTGIGRVAVTRALKQLVADGMLAQPHGERAPYIPLYHPDGTRVRPALIVVSEENGAMVQEQAAPDLSQVSAEELAAELVRRSKEGS